MMNNLQLAELLEKTAEYIEGMESQVYSVEVEKRNEIRKPLIEKVAAALSEDEMEASRELIESSDDTTLELLEKMASGRSEEVDSMGYAFGEVHGTADPLLEFMTN